jgi:hypothetical protein
MDIDEPIGLTPLDDCLTVACADVVHPLRCIQPVIDDENRHSLAKRDHRFHVLKRQSLQWKIYNSKSCIAKHQ